MSPERKAALLSYVRAGAPLEVACRVIGITPQTLRNWRARAAAEPPEEPYASFIEELEQVEALTECEAVKAIYRIGCGMLAGATDRHGNALCTYEQPPDWRAFAWWLARRFPKRWGHLVTIERDPRDWGFVVIARSPIEARAATALVREVFGEHALPPQLESDRALAPAQ